MKTPKDFLEEKGFTEQVFVDLFCKVLEGYAIIPSSPEQKPLSEIMEHEKKIVKGLCGYDYDPIEDFHSWVTDYVANGGISAAAYQYLLSRGYELPKYY